MATSDQAILDAARESLLRILTTDAAEMEEKDRRLRALEIDKLEALIDKYEKRVSSGAGRRILNPVKRVNI